MSAKILPLDRGSDRPNLLLNHGVLMAYPGNLLDGVAGVDKYGARVIASSLPGDVVQLHPEFKDRKLLDPIREHYRRVGLDVATDFVFDESWGVIDAFPDLQLDAFFFDKHVHAVAPDQLWLETAATMNDKNEFIQYCWDLGTPVPGTALFDSADDFDRARIRAPFPLYVKGAVSASGMHVIRVEDEAGLAKAVRTMPGAFQVQEALPPGTIFCNIQYSGYGPRLNHGPLTLQQLEGNAHAGNVYPAAGVDLDIIQPITDKLALTLFDQGMRGTWAFDVAYHDGQVWVIEMNPRWNGATYYSTPAERLGAEAWEGLYVHTHHDSFDFMLRNPSDWEYDPHRRNGIVIVGWGTIGAGKLGLLVIGSPDQRRSLLETFQGRFCS